MKGTVSRPDDGEGDFASEMTRGKHAGLHLQKLVLPAFPQQVLSRRQIREKLDNLLFFLREFPSFSVRRDFTPFPIHYNNGFIKLFPRLSVCTGFPPLPSSSLGPRALNENHISDIRYPIMLFSRHLNRV